MQLLPVIDSPVSPVTSILPLAFVITVTAIKQVSASFSAFYVQYLPAIIVINCANTLMQILYYVPH